MIADARWVVRETLYDPDASAIALLQEALAEEFPAGITVYVKGDGPDDWEFEAVVSE